MNTCDPGIKTNRRRKWCVPALKIQIFKVKPELIGKDLHGPYNISSSGGFRVLITHSQLSGSTSDKLLGLRQDDFLMTRWVWVLSLGLSGFSLIQKPKQSIDAREILAWGYWRDHVSLGHGHLRPLQCWSSMEKIWTYRNCTISYLTFSQYCLAERSCFMWWYVTSICWNDI